MVSNGDHGKVLNPVVVFDSVEVMHMLVSTQRTPEMLLHHKAVFKDRQNDVAVLPRLVLRPRHQVGLYQVFL